MVGAFQMLHNMVGMLYNLYWVDAMTALGVTDMSANFWKTRAEISRSLRTPVGSQIEVGMDLEEQVLPTGWIRILSTACTISPVAYIV